MEYLIDEIMKARKSCLGEAPESQNDPTGTFRHTLDVKEFLKFTIPRQVVFFELGFDLAFSNTAQTIEELEKSLYGLMIVNTPRAFLHLLNSCIFTLGKSTYIDLLPFFNPTGGSELSILRIIIHHQKFELLTHPLCELFLYLKWLRSRMLYLFVIFLNGVFTLLTIVYVTVSYGNLQSFAAANSTTKFENHLKNSHFSRQSYVNKQLKNVNISN